MYIRRQVNVYHLVFTTRPVSYTHLRAHETSLHLVCRLLLERMLWGGGVWYVVGFLIFSARKRNHKRTLTVDALDGKARPSNGLAARTCRDGQAAARHEHMAEIGRGCVHESGGDAPLGAALNNEACLLYTSPSPRDLSTSRMPSSA